MSRYEFSMTTDHDFDFTYYGKETQYCDSLRILFEAPDALNIKLVLERLDQIQILAASGKTHYKDARKRLELLKKEIRDGNIDDVTFGGNYSFSFKKLDDEYDDVVYCP